MGFGGYRYGSGLAWSRGFMLDLVVLDLVWGLVILGTEVFRDGAGAYCGVR